SSDLSLFASLNDLDFATLDIDGQSTEAEASPDIILVDMSAAVARSYGAGDPPRPPLRQISLGCRGRKGVREATKNIVLKKVVEEYGLKSWKVMEEYGLQSWKSMAYKKVMPRRIMRGGVTMSASWSGSSRCTTLPEFGWLLEEIYMTWAHLEKKRTRLRLYTKSLEEIIIQTVETASPAIAKTYELDQDGVRIFKMASGFSRWRLEVAASKETLKASSK
ncbi:hypothetical protein Tco_1117693, partial [Tanacetum coccineum]